MMKNTVLVAVACGAALAGCRSPQEPREIDATGDEAITGMGVDFKDMVRFSEALANDLVSSGFVDIAYGKNDERPILMTLSDATNNTTERNLPLGEITGRVRAAALNSGKVEFSSAVTADDSGRDTFGNTLRRESQESEEFDPDTVPEDRQLRAPQYTLRTEVNSVRSRNSREQQLTYVVRMFVTEVATGTVKWEKFSPPIAKRGSARGGGVGL